MIAYSLCSLFAILYLPTLFPLSPSASDSYVFGYNNRVGILLLLLLSTIGAAWSRALKLEFHAPGPSQSVPLKDLGTTLIAVLLACVAMYVFVGRFGGFGESSYEIDRIWLLSQGKTPYIDFEWPFGVGLLYGPLLIRRLFASSVVQAYYIFWAFNCMLGNLLLFAVINLIDYPTKFKRQIFYLLFMAWFLSILNMGTHYTLVRYTCPLLFVLIVDKSLSKNLAAFRTWPILLSIAFTSFLFLISPEVAIAHAFACICLFVPVRPSKIDLNPIELISLSAGFAVTLGAALRLHLLDTAKASGAGADSFPIAFAPHTLMFFVTLYVCGCYVHRCRGQRQLRGNTLGLIGFSIPMVAAALGRCDPGHVFLNGLGVFICAMFYFSRTTKSWQLYRGAFVVTFMALSAISAIWFTRPAFLRAAYNILGESDRQSMAARSINFLGQEYLSFATPAIRAKWQTRLAHIQEAPSPHAIDLSKIYPEWHGEFLAPFGFKPNGFGTYLSSQVDYGHFEAFENANSSDSINRKVAEIATGRERALLLPEDFQNYCAVDVHAEQLELSMLFAFPYLGHAVHPVSMRKPVCNYILANFEMKQPPTMDDFNYGLWIAKPGVNLGLPQTQ